MTPPRPEQPATAAEWYICPVDKGHRHPCPPAAAALPDVEELAAVFREKRWALVDIDKMAGKYGLPADLDDATFDAIAAAILAELEGEG